MVWKIRRIMKKERRKGKVVRLGNRGIWIENRWWYWDEEKEGIKEGMFGRRIQKNKGKLKKVKEEEQGEE